MRNFIKKILREGLLSEGHVTQGQLNQLEQELDDLFRSVGIDIEFTRHFLDRVNDARNGKEITIDELRAIFKRVYSRYSDKIKALSNNFEGVFKNRPTNINIPFVLKWDSRNKEIDLISKTIMRKPNFGTSNDVLPLNVTDKDIAPEETKELDGPVIKIGNIEWVVDKASNMLVSKKNNNVKHNIDSILGKVDDETAKNIMNALK